MRTITLIGFREISKALRQMRQRSGMTLKEVAAQSGLSFSFISDLERGRTKPSLDTLDLLFAVYKYECSIAVELL